MNITKAREMNRALKESTGALLGRLKQMKSHPDNFSTKDFIRAHRQLGELNRSRAALYRKFPELKPIRAKQVCLELSWNSSSSSTQ